MRSESSSLSSTTPTDRRAREARLVAIWEGGTLHRTLPVGARIVVGRAASTDLPVPHVSVSREHAVVRVADSVTIEDLGSHNGTRVAGTLIPPGRQVTVPAGATIEVDRALLIVEGRPDVVSIDERWRRLDEMLPLVARGSISVLLRGETGVGKEVTVHTIHKLSPRRDGPLVSLHCAALPETLLEAELFGYERGAFTGAAGAKAGLLESADRGTVFLDEVGEMPLTTQAKLLRVVETKTVTRLGALRSQKIDVRFVSATNRDLESMIEQGTFRSDLYYRIAAISLQIPPLRVRPTEIDGLAETFLADAAREAGLPPSRLTPAATLCLHAYSWPGNIRELRNAIEGAVLLASGADIEPCHLPPPVRASGDHFEGSERRTLRQELEAIERRRIADALSLHKGNRTRVAEALGIPRRTLLERLRVYGLGGRS